MVGGSISLKESFYATAFLFLSEGCFNPEAIKQFQNEINLS